MPGIGMEIGMEARGHRDAQGAGGTDSGSAQRSLRRDMHQVGTISTPAASQPATGRQAEAEERITRDRDAGQGHLLILWMRISRWQIGPARAIDRDRVPPTSEF